MTIFGHSYAGILAALESELGRAASMRPPHLPHPAAHQRRFNRLSARYLAVDDNPRLRLRKASAPQVEKDPSLYAAFNVRMNVSIRRLFQALGYDRSSPSASPRQVGFVYTNELEECESAADSCCVFTSRQVAVIGEEMVKCTRGCRGVVYRYVA